MGDLQASQQPRDNIQREGCEDDDDESAFNGHGHLQRKKAARYGQPFPAQCATI